MTKAEAGAVNEKRAIPGDDTRGEAGLARVHRRFGWTSLFVWMTGGLLLESLQGWKSAAYLLDPLRRELWLLAHFHGALLAVVNLVYVRWAESPGLAGGARTLASRALLAGSVLLPLGFLLGGLQHFEGDPGWGIFLAPVGGAALLVTTFLQVRAAWRG